VGQPTVGSNPTPSALAPSSGSGHRWRTNEVVVSTDLYGHAMKVRAVIRMLEDDGWRLDRQRGSHRQYRHPTKRGTVTIAGKASDELKTGTLASIFRQAGIEGKR
jgi:predicted RNA binding protein YcfA (HicA-like mRNA interferase family)